VCNLLHLSLIFGDAAQYQQKHKKRGAASSAPTKIISLADHPL
jgi:hypothetical protein